jgi:outer membrane protein assembly factor BamE
MVFDLVAVFGGNRVLQAFDFRIEEFDDLAGVEVEHMVMVFAAIQFEYRLPAFEVVLDHDAGGFELHQHAIDRGQADIFVVVQQVFENFFSGQVLAAGVFEDFKDAHARQRDLQPGFAQVLSVQLAVLVGISQRLAGVETFQNGTPAVQIGFYTRLAGASVKKRPEIAYSCAVWVGCGLACMIPVFADWIRTSMRFATLLFATVLLSGCGLIYKVDIRQGNVVDQKMVDQLKPGMTKRQVELVMGTPQVASPFDQNRWEYLTATSRRGRQAEIKNLSLQFDGDTLARIVGDWQPQNDDELLEQSQELQKNNPEDNVKRPGG